MTDIDKQDGSTNEQKILIKLFSGLFKKLNEEIIKNYGGALGSVNYGNLDFSIWRALIEAEKEKNGYDATIVWAANLLRNIAVSHPFKDGNKRTAYVAARLILAFNPDGPLYLKIPYNETEEFIIKVADKKKDIDEIKEWLTKHSVPISEMDAEISKELNAFLDSLFRLMGD